MRGNIGNFSDDGVGAYYWSSTQFSPTNAFSLSFNTSDDGYNSKSGLYRVRPVRAFGYTLGCMDSLACNYNPEANMADGSCEYLEQGYDCEGNITAEIGDIIEGGYLFYLDESGQHGLVAALDDIEGTYEWGCYGTSILGADGQSIGTGYQNTLDIESVCSETPIAASEALAYESEGYIDWYLPSIDELSNIYSALNTL